MQEIGKLSKILVAIDGSEPSMKAADFAISEAKRNNAKLIALNVICLPTCSSDYVFLPYAEMVDAGKQEAEKWFEIIRHKAQQSNVEVNTDVVTESRSATAGIVDYAEKEKVDMIIVGTTGRSAIKRVLLGNVASGVVTYATCPVMVIR
ncbi:MAG: universal stress protein [Thaumarchaeota archaeon]|nr:universal stress protein [Nitrososphaerota archaeon]